MNSRNASTSHLLLVLDEDYGDRLRDVWPGQPVWIVLSPINEPIVSNLREKFPAIDHLAGITGIKSQSFIDVQQRILTELESIELHHGPYSTGNPYTVLEVVGCGLSDQIKRALIEIGFTKFQPNEEGFVATRSAEQASIRR